MTKLFSYRRKKCRIDDCTRLSRNKGFYKGKTRWGNVCVMHHKMRYGGLSHYPLLKENSIPNNKCENCGWDKTFCDRHRLNPKLGYVKENIKILCPNCHRLATIKLLNF